MPTGMRPARRVGDGWWREASRSRQGLIACVGIGLDHPAEPGEMLTGPFAFAVRAEAIERRRCTVPAPGPLIDQVGPKAAKLGPTVAGGQHLDRRVVGMDDRRRHHMGADQTGQGGHPPGGMADPIGQGRALDRDALARQDCRLAIERQSIQILRHHDIGE